jgi:hypothetical protein
MVKVEFFVAAFAVGGFAPCLAVAQPMPSEPSGPAACVAERARFVVGRPYSEAVAEEARQAAGARIVRKIEPGGAYTMELRPDRLNLEVDRADVVQRVRCG